MKKTEAKLLKIAGVLVALMVLIGVVGFYLGFTGGIMPMPPSPQAGFKMVQIMLLSLGLLLSSALALIQIHVIWNGEDDAE